MRRQIMMYLIHTQDDEQYHHDPRSLCILNFNGAAHTVHQSIIGMRHEEMSNIVD